MTIHRIAVAGRKGGVGKTTISCGLASIFAHQGYRVLIIDLDPQSNVAFAFGVRLGAAGTAQLLTEDVPIGEKVSDLITVYPGGTKLESSAIQNLPRETLARKVDTLEGFDVIIFDCPPGIKKMEQMALTAAKTALITMNAHPLSLLGAIRVQKQLSADLEKGKRIASRHAVILSQLNQTRKRDKGISGVLPKYFPDTPHMTVQQDAGLYNAMAEQQEIMDYAPKSRGAENLTKIAQWIING